MAQHTQFAPLRDSGAGFIDLPDGRFLFVGDASLRGLIVRAVNSHGALVDALEDCIALIRGDISGRSQRLGILLDAAKALREATSPLPNKEAA